MMIFRTPKSLLEALTFLQQTQAKLILLVVVKKRIRCYNDLKHVMAFTRKKPSLYETVWKNEKTLIWKIFREINF